MPLIRIAAKPFAALDIAPGAVIGKGFRRHRATEFLDFQKQIDSQMPKAREVHVVLDNYATLKASRIKAVLERYPMPLQAAMQGRARQV